VQLIEHIRATGRMGSGAMDIFWHERHPEPEGPPPLHKNAPERNAALTDANVRAQQAKLLRDFYQSPAEKARRRARLEEKRRQELEWQQEQAELQAEWDTQKRQKKLTQAERDLEWEQATLFTMQSRFLRVAARFKDVRIKLYPKFRFMPAWPAEANTKWKCNCCVPYNGRWTPDYWGTGQKDCW